MQGIMHPWRDGGKMKTQNMHIGLSENQSARQKPSEKKDIQIERHIVNSHFGAHHEAGYMTIFLHLSV